MKTFTYVKKLTLMVDAKSAKEADKIVKAIENIYATDTLYDSIYPMKEDGPLSDFNDEDYDISMEESCWM